MVDVGHEEKHDPGEDPRRDRKQGHSHEKQRHIVNWLERLVIGVSLLLLLGVIGFLVWEGLAGTEATAFSAEVRQVHQVGTSFHAELDIRNTGDESVQNLGIRAQVRDGETILAEAETALSWLPAESLRRAAVVLPLDPRDHTLEIVFLGYEFP